MEEYSSLAEIAQKLKILIRKLLYCTLSMQLERQDYQWNLKV